MFAASAALTLVVAWPVVERPTERIYGSEIAGRHPDPFAAMRRLDTSIRDAFTQPATDWTGAAIARLIGPVGAYNVIVLLSFPLAAAATDLFVFLLTGSAIASLTAGLLVMFAPYHLAHAAYHPHVAQIGWLALVFAAVVAFVDRPSVVRAGALGVSLVWLGAADFYGGFIGLTLAPVVALTRAATTRRRESFAAAAVVAAGGVAALAGVSWWLHARAAAPYFNDAQVLMFRARWWAYFLPPVDQPIWGAHSVQTIGEAAATPAIVELQLTPGIAVLALAACGMWFSASGSRDRTRQGAALALALISAGAIASLAPVAIWLHDALPAFRSMARFGGAAGIGVSALAGLGLAGLCERVPSRRTAILAVAALTVFVEYAPLPWRWRDVLPTEAHRWLAGLPASATVLDCSAPLGGDAAVEMAFGSRVTEAGGPLFPACGDSDMVARASANRVAFVLVRTGSDLALAWTSDLPSGLRVMRRFPGASVYAVTSAAPPVFVDRLGGCGVREWRNDRSFCWARQHVDLAVRNTGPTPLRVTLALALQTVSGGGAVRVSAPGTLAQSIDAIGPLKPYTIGPFTLPPGVTTLALDAVDRNPFAIGPWRWIVDPS